MAIETTITGGVVSFLEGLPHCTVEKLKGSATSSGKSDLNGCYCGRSFRFEMKTPDHRNRSSAKQNIDLRRWYNAGAIVAVVYSKQFIVELFNRSGEWYQLGGNYTMKEPNGCISWAKIPPLRSSSWEVTEKGNKRKGETYEI